MPFDHVKRHFFNLQIRKSTKLNGSFSENVYLKKSFSLSANGRFQDANGIFFEKYYLFAHILHTLKQSSRPKAAQLIVEIVIRGLSPTPKLAKFV